MLPLGRSSRFTTTLATAAICMAWALHAVSRGAPEQQIREEILHGRDLSKQGRLARQLDYAERTTLKALGRLRHSN